MPRSQHKPILSLFFRILAECLNFLFTPIGWLLSPLFDRWCRSAALEHQAKFEQDIRDAIPFLFTEKAAVVVPNEGVPFPPGFDGAYVTLSTDSFRLQFMRGRGELSCLLAHPASPAQWHDLEILVAYVVDPDSYSRIPIHTLFQASTQLQANWPALWALFEPAKTPELSSFSEELHRREAAGMRAWEEDINRKLYGA